ncbi:MAG: hypothetical protein HYV07_07890 [Deltaproteobacteria bacterium]|nr:hypothetical protein [Deltaproteobacteria bacterium]
MKATIDIPLELYRQVKARSALEGRSVREVTIGLFRRWLGEKPAESSGRGAEDWVDGWLELGESVLGAARASPTGTEVLAEDRARLEPR